MTQDGCFFFIFTAIIIKLEFREFLYRFITLHYVYDKCEVKNSKEYEILANNTYSSNFGVFDNI